MFIIYLFSCDAARFLPDRPEKQLLSKSKKTTADRKKWVGNTYKNEADRFHTNSIKVKLTNFTVNGPHSFLNKDYCKKDTKPRTK